MRGLLWGLSGKESSCRCRRHGFEPWSGKIPLATERLSPCATTLGPVLWSWGAETAEPTCHNCWSLCALEPVLRNKRGHCNEKPGHRNWRVALFITAREKLSQQRAAIKKKCCMRMNHFTEHKFLSEAWNKVVIKTRVVEPCLFRTLERGNRSDQWGNPYSSCQV